MKIKITCLIAVVLIVCNTMTLYGRDWMIGLGFNAGISRLEGDLGASKLSPIVSGHLKFLPLPYVGLLGEVGYSSLNTSSDPFLPLTDFRTRIIPFELSAIFNFLPFGKVNPYVFAGGGGVWWSADANSGGTTVTFEDGIDSFLKTGGGIEFLLGRNVGLNLGATYRYSLTDAFDQLPQGDENDQVVDVHAGLTYYFNIKRNDKDRDGIPDELDLMPDIAEDRDGYLDHDGIPEKNPESGIFGEDGQAAPIVVHHLVEKAESGRNVLVKASVYSGVPLRVVAALYRPLGTPNWNVVRLESYGDNLYEGQIPGYAITTDGLEYCVVAVDETLSGIGYSGLPSKPIYVPVSPSGTPWRIVGGVIGAAAIGTASYFIVRKQN